MLKQAFCAKCAIFVLIEIVIILNLSNDQKNNNFYDFKKFGVLILKK